MKIIRIFLFVLIIIGVIALITEKIWVPKLVDRIIKMENISVVLPATEQNIPKEDGRQCYTYNHEATKTEPYAVSEFIDMNIKGKVVTGTKTGTQKGPDMTNGYTGTIEGNLEGDTITSVFSYVIEGSKNKEKEIYKVSKIGLEKLRYPLVDSKGILVPDITKEFKTLSYSRVGCTASN